MGQRNFHKGKRKKTAREIWKYFELKEKKTARANLWEAADGPAAGCFWSLALRALCSHSFS